MSNFDWEKMGNDIKNSVQQAIDSQDFNQLSSTINKTVHDAMGTLSDGLRQAGVTAGNAINQGKTQTQIYQERIRREKEAAGLRRPDVINRDGTVANSPYFARITPARVGGVLMAITGFTMAGIFTIMGLVLGLGAVVTAGTGLGAILGVAITTSVLSALSFALGIGGVKKLGLAGRFSKIVAALGNKEYIEFNQLTDTLRKPVKFIQRDVNRMINKGWFRQGRIDGQKTSLMVSDKVYADYQKMVLQIEEKKIHDEAEAMRKDVSNLDEGIQDIVKAGDEYIKKIRKCNDEITGAEISAKIDRIEILLERIFGRVREEPKTAVDTRRLMEYYLPTTIKLLEAYIVLNNQPVKGDNIIKSKKEIEETLDTLNLAFEKMLNSMFQSKAIDLSTDISVLNTMLAQEGLTKEDFK